MSEVAAEWDPCALRLTSSYAASEVLALLRAHFGAVARVGLYVPGGSAVLPSTCLMLGVPASVARCKEIVIATPPRSVLRSARLLPWQLCSHARPCRMGYCAFAGQHYRGRSGFMRAAPARPAFWRSALGTAAQSDNSANGTHADRAAEMFGLCVPQCSEY